MGILCSKSSNFEKVNVDTGPCVVSGGIQSSNVWTSEQSDLVVESKRRSLEKQLLGLDDQQTEDHYLTNVHYDNLRVYNHDDYYDGIPRVPTTLSHKSRSMRSTQAAVAKVWYLLFVTLCHFFYLHCNL